MYQKKNGHAKGECTLSGLQMLSKTWSSRAEVLGMSGGRVLGDSPSSTFPGEPSVASSPNRATSNSLSDASAWMEELPQRPGPTFSSFFLSSIIPLTQWHTAS